MEAFIPVVLIFGGIAIGALIVWLLMRTQSRRSFEQGQADGAMQIAALQERLSARDQEVQRLQQSLEKEAGLREQLRESTADLKAQLEGERRAAQERSESFKHAAEELSEKFKALSRDALKDNNQSFLDLARANLAQFQTSARGDLELRQRAIDQLVKPLKESLERVDGKIGEMEKARAGAYSELREQVRALTTSQLQLQAETGNLVKALRTPHIRGRWGEIQLRRVVELAGMLQYCDFTEQESVTGEDGRIRPDVIVRLPGNRTIVVDAKVPFDAFYESISATDDAVRLERSKDHARLVRTHIGALSRKSYWETVQPTPEFVLLFLPGENFYSVALEHDPKLIEDGVNQGVIIATPTTLIALLKAVSYGWRQEQMAANAEEVGRLGKELYDRLRKFTDHFDDIGRGLDRAVEAYNKGVGSFEQRIMVTARKFKERGAIAGDEVEELKPIDKLTRSLSRDDGGLFPEPVAIEPVVAEDDEDSMPLLSSRATGQG
jgi:DNA recombination protein RmuC